MKKLILAAAAIAAFGLILPVATPSAEAQTMVIRSGNGPHHRHVDRGHRRNVVVAPVRRDHGWHHRHREGRNNGLRVIVR